MQHNEAWLYAQIRRHESLIIYLLSVIGRCTQASIEISALIQSGTDDPNVAGVVPFNPAIGGFYRQSINDSTVVLWIWDNGSWK